MSEKCPYCGSTETVHNQAINDTLCQACGRWADENRSNNNHINDVVVVVIPSEEGYGVSQESTVEQILACPGKEIYRLGDYFKAQNDEALPLLHWSFLINAKTNEELTGLDIL